MRTRSGLGFLFLVLAHATSSSAQSPAIEAGDWLHINLRARAQTDVRRTDVPLPGGSLQMGQRRLGVDGRVTRLVGFELEYDTGSRRWKDAYLDYQQFKPAQLRAGIFKVPFGLEATTSGARLDFVRRSRISERLAPGRHSGAVLHGKALRARLEYEAGAFSHEGTTLAARVVAAPFRHSRTGASALQIGVALSRSDAPLGRSDLRGRTALGLPFYKSRAWVQGARTRAGVEGRWHAGRARLQGEYIRLSDQRLGQSVEDGDLPPLVGQGWYLSATYRLIRKRQIGRLEAAGRVETVRFGSAGGEGAPSSSARAPRVLGNGEDVVTLGLNWRPHPWVTVQTNLIRERLQHPSISDQPDRSVLWSRIVRLQFAL